MSIQNNIESLQLVLETVNSLPDQDNTTEVNLQAKTITPNAGGQIVRPDSGYTGLSQVTISGDSDLVASNIKSGVNIFGITGTMSAGTTVQKNTGSLTTDSSGGATVNVGFKPDIVGFYSGNTNYDWTICSGAMFTEAGKDQLSIMQVTGDSNAAYSQWDIARTSTGFYLSAYKIFADWSGEAEGGRSIQYYAIKYT